MILEIYLTIGLVGIATLIIGIIYAQETNNPLLLLLSTPFLITTALSSGMVEIVEFSEGTILTETVGYGSLMMLFTALTFIAIALTIAFSVKTIQ